MTKAKNALVAAVQGASRVPHHPYMIENDRWLDLIVLMLIDGAGLTKTQALTITKHLGAEQLPKGQHRKYRAALRSEFEATIHAPTFDHQQMDAIAKVIDNTALAIKKRYGGGMQTFLRTFGDQMVDDLSKMLRESGLTEPKARRIATLWLQNVANMPVLSTQGSHVRAFCKSNGLTARQLIGLADNMGINVAYLDDVLLMLHSETSGKRSKKKTVRST